MNNCATCRWWKEGTAEKVVMMRYSGETDYPYISPAESSECKLNPTPVLKGAADFCGQWKGREETRYFDEDGLIISENEARLRYPEHFPRSDPYDGKRS